MLWVVIVIIVIASSRSSCINTTVIHPRTVWWNDGPDHPIVIVGGFSKVVIQQCNELLWTYIHFTML
jgi:hypothetical protein